MIQSSNIPLGVAKKSKSYFTLLPVDINVERSLYSKYPEFLYEFPHLTTNFWIRKAAIDIDYLQVDDQFIQEFKNYNSEKWEKLGLLDVVRYLRILALHGISVRGDKIEFEQKIFSFPGSELFICDSEMISYAVQHEDLLLAKYVVENLKTTSIRIYDEILESLNGTLWIDLLIKLAENLPGKPSYELNYAVLLYNGIPASKILTLRDILHKVPKYDDHYEDDITQSLPTMMGIYVNSEDPLVVLALEYGHEKLAKNIIFNYDPEDDQIVIGWLLSPKSSEYKWNKIKSYLTPDLYYSKLSYTIAKIDDLEIMKGILSHVPNASREKFLISLLTYAKFGSKIFTWITNLPDLPKLVTAKVIRYKSYTDFAGLNTLWKVISKTKREEILAQKSEKFCSKVLQYLKNL